MKEKMINKELANNFWENYFSVYDELSKLIPYEELLNQIISEYKLPLKNNSVLDAGCGSGNLSVKLVEHGAEVVCLDSNTKALSLALAKSPESHHLLSDLESDLPFQDNQFDLLVCNNVFYTITNKESLLREFKRVLKEGGVLIISDPKENFKNYKIVIEDLVKRLHRDGPLLICEFYIRFFPKILKIWYYNVIIDMREAKKQYRFISASGLGEMLKKEGFIVDVTTSAYARQNNLIVCHKC